MAKKNLLPKILTVRQVAVLLNVHPETVRRWDRTKQLIAIRVGNRGHRRYLREEILKAIRTQMNNGRFKVDMRFGDGTASKKIVSVLTGSRLESLSLQKKFYAQ